MTFTGAADGLGRLHRGDHEVLRRPPSKASAQEQGVHFHLFWVEAGGRRGGLLDGGLRLTAGPHLHLVRLDPRGAVHGFHASVRQVGQVVACRDRPDEFEGSDISFAQRRDAVELSGLLERSAEVVGGPAGQRALAPLDLHQLGGPACVPVGVGHHGHTPRDRNHCLHTRRRFGFVATKAAHRGPERWRLDDHCVQHSGHAHVDAESRRAVHLGRGIQALH